MHVKYKITLKVKNHQ